MQKSIIFLVTLMTCLGMSLSLSAQKSKVTSGSMAVNNSDYAEAIRLLQEALSKPELLENKDKAKAWFKLGESFQGIVIKKDSNSLKKYPEALFDASHAFEECKKYDDIATYSKDIEARLPILGALMYQTGFVYYQQAVGQIATPEKFKPLIAQALKYFEKSVELVPSNSGLLSILGAAYRMNGQPDKALPTLEKSIQLYETRKDTARDKNMLFAYRDLAELYMNDRKEGDKAMAIIEKSYVQFPGNKELQTLELNYYLQGDQNMEKGIQKFESAIHDNPKSEEIHLAYAGLLEKKGDLESAAKMYDKVLAINPKSVMANYNMGAMFVNKAVEFSKKANETEEINQAAEFSKQVEVYFQKSLPYMEAAHAADPKDLYTVNALVQIYTQLNMMDKASEFTKLRSSLQK